MKPAFLENPGQRSVSGSASEEAGLKQFSCPSCGRVYTLSGGVYYMCARDHGDVVQSNGRMRNVMIQEWKDPEDNPWEIPEMVEERVAREKDFEVSLLYKCNHPGNRDYGDLTKHLFGVGHITREMVMRKYAEYVLRPIGVPPQVPSEAPPEVQGWLPVREPKPVETSSYSAGLTDTRKKQLILLTGLFVSSLVILVEVLRLLNLL